MEATKVKGKTAPQKAGLQMKVVSNCARQFSNRYNIYRPFPRARREFGTSVAPCRLCSLSVLFNRGECTAISLDEH